MELQKIKDFFKNLEFEVSLERFVGKNAESDVAFKINGETVYADVRNEVRPNHVPIFLNRKDNPLLVVADYITPKSKEALKSNGVNYIDSYANVYLNLKHLKIYVEKNNAKPVYNVYSEVFTRAGGQVLFQLLQDPELINANQERLAKISCVSLGSVSKTIKGLQKEGFAVKWNKEKKYQLVKREELLEKWVVLVNEKILPAHKVGNFKFSQNQLSDWYKNLLYPRLFWGGEPGASLLTKNLNPEKFTIYTDKTKQDIIQQFRLIPDEYGEIIIYNKFWQEKNMFDELSYVGNENTVHPLLIYAELIYSGNERNLETAKIIFDEYIKPNL